MDTIILIIAGVFGGNMLTAMFIYGFRMANAEEESTGKVSFLALGSLLFPLAFFILVALSTSEHLPPWLDAIAAQQ